MGIAASALAAERLLLSDQHPQRAALLASREACGYAHLKPVENRVGRVLQGCHAAAQILDVVEVALDGLANGVGEAGRAQPGGGRRQSDSFGLVLMAAQGEVAQERSGIGSLLRCCQHQMWCGLGSGAHPLDQDRHRQPDHHPHQQQQHPQQQDGAAQGAPPCA